jgi:hypothetical protein
VITDGTNSVNIALSSALSPIRGYLSLSETKELKLWSGKLSLQIGTAAVPAQITGTIGCVGRCSVPAKIPQGDMCTVTGNSAVLFDDALAPGWQSWSWGQVENANFQYTADKACGTTAIYTKWDGSSALSLHNDTAVDTSKYSHFEFMVRTAAGIVPFRIQFDDGADLVVESDEVVNYVIEETWTRVRVPLAQYQITGPVSRVSIASIWNTGDMELYIDQIRFVTSAAVDTLVDPVSGTAAPYQAPNNVCSPGTGTGLTGGGSPNNDDDGDMSAASSLIASIVLVAFALLALL